MPVAAVFILLFTLLFVGLAFAHPAFGLILLGFTVATVVGAWLAIWWANL